MALNHIAVGRIEQAVGIVEAVRGDGVVYEVMVEVQVYHQLGSEQIVNQREIVVLLHVERRITIADRNRIGLVDVGVQVRDTRARDAHVVGKTEVATLREGVLQTGSRHEGTIIFLEVVAVAKVVLYILPSVLVTQTCLQTKRIPGTCIFAITCKD